MESINMRKLDASELKRVRSQAARLKEMGKTGKETEGLTRVRRNRRSEIWTAYQREGKKALKPQKRGRKCQEQRLLSAEESKEIWQTVISTAPNRLKMAGFFWTLAKISQYIWDAYRKKVSLRSLSNYKRWRLTCRRPAKHARGQDAARIDRFKKEEYPAIAKRVEAENALVYWADGTGVSNCENFERGFAEKGKTPVLPMETKCERVNMISAVTNQWHTRFTV